MLTRPRAAGLRRPQSHRSLPVGPQGTDLACL